MRKTAQTTRLTPTKVLRSLTSAVNKHNYFPRNPKSAIQVVTIGYTEVIISGPQRQNSIQLSVDNVAKVLHVYDEVSGTVVFEIPIEPISDNKKLIATTARMLVNLVNPTNLPLLTT